jgi:hypothetical protein
MPTGVDDKWFPTDVQQKAEAIFAERKGKENFVEYEFRQWKGLRRFKFSQTEDNKPTLP